MCYARINRHHFSLFTSDFINATSYIFWMWSKGCLYLLQIELYVFVYYFFCLQFSVESSEFSFFLCFNFACIFSVLYFQAKQLEKLFELMHKPQWEIIKQTLYHKKLYQQTYRFINIFWFVFFFLSFNLLIKVTYLIEEYICQTIKWKCKQMNGKNMIAIKIV